MLAEGELTDVEIAAQAGITDQQLRRWKQDPDFATEVEALGKAGQRRPAPGHRPPQSPRPGPR